MIMALPHDSIAQIAAGAGGTIFVFIGIYMARKFWRQYQQSYLDGTATTLDSMYINMPAQNILYLGFLLGLGMLVVFGYISGNILIGIPFLIIGIITPKIVLSFLKKKRDKLFLIQLVDALMNMSNSLRAGFSLPQALELISREMPKPMCQEMRLVCQEMRLGVPAEDALYNLYKRMPSDDMDLVVTAIAIIRDVGGNLTEVFDNIAQLIRERQRIEGKIRTLTAQGKLQGVVMSLLPVFICIGLYIIAPDMFNVLFYTWQGWLALFGAAAMIGVAGFIISKIIKIDV